MDEVATEEVATDSGAMDEVAMKERHHHLAVGAATLHVVETGPAEAPAIVLLHGWPQTWQAWRAVMSCAKPADHVVAVDLPGVGESTGQGGATKRQLARTVHQLIAALGLRDVTLVGHDVGGMITYAYWRRYDDIARAVIMDVVIPGVEPWSAVEHNPRIWHFGLHQVPGLPEQLVNGRQGAYFDYFFDTLADDASRIGPDQRKAYAAGYGTEAALSAGFDWYRSFDEDAADNRDTTPVRTPLLYLRGERDPGDIEAYAAGLRRAGATDLRYRHIRDAGHFTPEEAPGEVWETISRFAA